MSFNFREIPCLRIGILLIGGILLSAYVKIDVAIYTYIYLLLFPVLINLISTSSTITEVSLILLIITMGSFRYTTAENNTTQHPVDRWQETLQFKGELISVQQTKKGTKQFIEVNELAFNDEQISCLPFTLLAYVGKDSITKVKEGDLIVAQGKIKRIPPISNPVHFDYPKFLHYQGIDFQTYIQPVNYSIIGKRKPNYLEKLCLDIRSYCLNILSKSIDQNENLQICKALVLGQRKNLNKETKEIFSESGAMHVLAVSGLHVGILAGFLHFLFSLIPSSLQWINQLKKITIIILIWMFAFITGAAPAVLRAATMFSLYITGMSFYRETNGLNILGASAIILLLLNPFLLFQTGFQFSFLALLSIILFYPRLKILYTTSHTLLNYLWQLVALSMAAQILVFPLGILYFNQFPVYFILSGLVAVPVASVILISSLLLFVFSGIPVVGQLIADILNITLRFFHQSIKTVSELPFSTIQNWNFQIDQIMLLYIVIFSIILALIYKFPLRIVAFSFLLFSGSCYFQNLELQKQRLVIYNVKKGLAVDIISSSMVHTYVNPKVDSIALYFASKDIRSKYRIDQVKQIDLTDKISDSNFAYEQNLAWCNNTSLFILNQQSPLPSENMNVDLLLIDQAGKEQIEKALTVIHPKQVVVSRGVPYYQMNRIRQLASSYTKCQFHFIDTDGFFSIKT